MKPLIVLVAVFLITALVLKLTNKLDWALAGRVAMAAMLCFTAIGHFAFADGMAMMVPDVVPFKKEMVYATGVLEVLFGIGLLVPSLRVYTAWALIAFLVLMLPANIKAAIERVDYQNATYTGAGLGYLWFRVPLQVVFIVWTYLAGVR
ncbi:MAG: hypothetical protein R2800_01665 [Flavipsychrobacter sp.]